MYVDMDLGMQNVFWKGLEEFAECATSTGFVVKWFVIFPVVGQNREIGSFF